MPYIIAWADKYKNAGLVVIGVHSPEFAFEKDLGNVKKPVQDLGIMYPIAVDNDYSIWKAFNNNYWFARYLIDTRGRIRHHHFGEGDSDRSERLIQALLRERNGDSMAPSQFVEVSARGGRFARSRFTGNLYWRLPKSRFCFCARDRCGEHDGIPRARPIKFQSVETQRLVECRRGKCDRGGSSRSACVSISCARPAFGRSAPGQMTKRYDLK